MDARRGGVIYAADGRIWRSRLRDVGSGDPERSAAAPPEEIRFEAIHQVRRWSGLRRPKVSPPGARRRARGLADPALSPQADRVVFSALGDLWVSDTAAIKPRRLTDTPDHEHGPLWSPDGRWIAYWREAAGRESVLRLISPDGAESKSLPVPGYASIAWSPTGRRLAFFRGEDSGSAQAGWLAPDSETVRSIPLGSLRESAWRSAGPRGLLGWSADGDSIALHLERFDWGAPGDLQYVHEIRLLDVETGGSRSLSVPEGSWLRAAWSTGLEVGAFSFRGQAYTTSLLAPVEPAALPDPYARDFRWSADARHLVYVDGDRLRLHDRSTGSTRTLPVEVSYRTPSSPSPVLIRRVRVLDGSRDTLIGPKDVLLSGGRIERIAPAGSLEPPEGGQVLVAPEAGVLMPGLINTHVHLPAPPWSAGLAGPHFLYYGTTTVRDLGSEIGWIVGEAERIASGLGIGPRILASGGHVERETGGGRDWKWIVDPGDSASALAATEALGRAGADIVKIWLRDPSLAASVPKAAHQAGLPVTSHYPYAASFAWGLEGKEHILDYYRRPVGPYRQDLLSLLEAAGTCVTATLLDVKLLNTPLVASRLFPVSLDDLEPVRHLLSPSVDSSLVELFAEPMSPAQAVRADSVLGLHLDNVRRLHEAGVLLATGTDAFGFDARTDLEARVLEAAGLSAAEAIRAATSDAARCVGLDRELGTVEEGKWADLLLLSRNPLEGLEVLNEIEWVIAGGKVHRRSDLLH